MNVNKKNNRMEVFDVIRAIVIISAVIIHFDEKFGLGVLALPSVFVQQRLFDVGSFFFFTSGYMAFKIYLPSMKENWKATTVRLCKKGAEIFALYVAYVVFMRFATGGLIPSDIYQFLFVHEFFNIVLFTFSIIFILSPCFMGLYVQAKPFFSGFTIFLFCIYAYVLHFGLPGQLQDGSVVGIMFGTGAKRLYYPVLPALLTYCLGLIFASFRENKKYNDMLNVIPAPILLLFLIFYASLIVISKEYGGLIVSRMFFPLTASVLIFIVLLCVERIVQIRKLHFVITNPSFLLLGRNTLVFYVTSNLLLGLMSLSKEGSLVFKSIMFIFMVSLAYLVAQWSYYSRNRNRVASQND